jgi:hypothetical protein
MRTSFKTNMWRVVVILALTLSGCVSTKPLDQAFGAGQGRRIINAEIAYLLASPAGRSKVTGGTFQRAADRTSSSLLRSSK